MSDEKKVRDAWDAFVAAAKAATHLAVCPGASIAAPVRISAIGPAPAPKAMPIKPAPVKTETKSPIFVTGKKDPIGEIKGASE